MELQQHHNFDCPQLGNNSVFSLYYNVFNPYSILYTNVSSEFGLSVGLLKFVIEGVGITSLCIFGVIGNLLSILVLSSPQMGASSTSYFLRCLAICDTLNIICITLVVGIPSLLAFNPEGGTSNSTWLLYNKRIVEYSRIVPTPPIYQTAVIFFTGSVLFTMTLTMDRYFAICKPFKTIQYDRCSSKRSRYVALCVFMGAILYNLPRYWENVYLPLKTEFDNLTAYVPVPTSMRKNLYYDALYVHMSYVVLLFVTPVIFLSVFNIIIYREIRRSRKLRKSMASGPEKSLAYMLFGIVIVFLLCQIVPVGHAIYRYAKGDVGTDAYVPEVEFIMMFFFVLSSSVNFLIYCVSGTKFRRAMLNVFSGKWNRVK